MGELGVIGVNSKSCPLGLREILTRAVEACFGNDSCDRALFPYVYLSTCHRVEIYFSGSDIAAIHMYILAMLRNNIAEAFEPYLYSFFEEDVFLHLGKVTCGLDSAIIGESEIQHQVKKAYEKAKTQQVLSSKLHYLFQKSLMLGKEIRSKYGHWKQEFSLEDLIVEKIETFFANPKELPILFIGNSQTNRKLIKIFMAKKFQELFLISRCSVDIAMQHNIAMLPREELQSFWKYPIVISATNQLDPLLQTTIDQKRLVFDLSIPRTIDPNLKDLTNTILLNIEDLGALFHVKKQLYQQEISYCERLIKERVKQRSLAYEIRQARAKQESESLTLYSAPLR